jgi:monothiol glutaredoxin
MKGVPEAPMCGFSSMACRILDAYGVDYGSRNVLEDPELREGIKKFTHWPTIPQIFIKGEFVGGSDILMQMHQKGELEEAFGTPEE